MTTEVRLVRKACRRGDAGERFAGGNQRAGASEAAHKEIAVRARRVEGAELARQRIAVEAGFALELGGRDLAQRMGVEVVARHLRPPNGRFFSRTRALPGAALEAAREAAEQVVALNFVERRVERVKRLAERGAERRVVDHRRGDKRRRRCLVERRGDQGRLDIEHAVAEARFVAGAAVVDLVGMEHDDLPGEADALRAAIPEALHARECEADRVGVVTMARIGRAEEARLNPLDAVGVRRGDDAFARRALARTFKTAPDLGAYASARLHRIAGKESPMFDTKFAIVLRDDLAQWQALNVVAYLTSGVVAAAPEIIGEAYRDNAGNVYNPMTIQPTIVLAADAVTISDIHRRALARGVRTSAYVEEMFLTGHDAANRAVFSGFGPDEAKIVGVAMRAEKKLVDKIVKGARMHP